MEKESFQSLVKKPEVDALRLAVKAAKAGDIKGYQQVRAAMSWAAYACPAALLAVYDTICSEWSGVELPAATISADHELPIGENFWAAYWSLIEDADKGYDAISITLRAAGLGAYLNEGFEAASIAAARQYEGYDQLDFQWVPDFINLDALAMEGNDSLAMDLYRMWVENGYDPEVLDRDAIGLSELPPPLRFLNTRILQMHDVWHLVAGYRTTALHEIAISSFQLAQFGHHYSAMFLAAIFGITLSRKPVSVEGASVLLQVISEAWVHGRQTPAMMPVAWESLWHKPIAEIRNELAIKPFTSQFPADLFEQMSAA